MKGRPQKIKFTRKDSADSSDATSENGNTFTSQSEKPIKEEGNSTNEEKENKILTLTSPISSTHEELTKTYGVCGIYSTKFKRYSSPSTYMILYCMSVFLQSMVVNGYINSSITTLERRFGLSSTQSSIIPSIYDVGCIIFVLPVSFFGNEGYKPRWVGYGTLIMGLGCFVFATPHFLTGKYKTTHEMSTPVLCYQKNESRNSEACNESTNTVNSESFHKYLLYSGMMIIGVGAAPLYTLGIVHIEEIVTKQMSALYVGISTAVTAIGPAVGYLMFGSLLTIYVDIIIPSPDMVPENHDIWVGAWWIGFLLAGVLFLLVGGLLCLMPKPVDSKHVKTSPITPDSYNVGFGSPSEDISTGNTHVKTSNISRRTFSSENLRDLLRMSYNMVTNLTYICLNIGTALTLLSLSGISTYGPKYLANMFNLKDSSATVTAGVISVPTLSFGALMGGVILNRNAWKLPGILAFMSVTTFLSVPLSLVFLLSCESPLMVGIETSNKGLGAPCNTHCGCLQNKKNYVPSCSVENKEYFSPCFAGCKSFVEEESEFFFKNCSCIINNDSSFSYDLKGRVCKSNSCNSFITFIIFLGIYLILTYLRGAPMITATMRAVKKREVSLALGFQSIISRLFGAIPGPIVFGYIIDNTCLLWSTICGKTGSCLRYNRPEFSYNFFLMIFSVTIANGFCFAIPRGCIRCRRKRPRVSKSSIGERPI